MIQRLLRGRLLYVSLGLFLILLYGWEFRHSLAERHHATSTAQTDTPIGQRAHPAQETRPARARVDLNEWVTSPLDAERFKDALLREPQLGVPLLALTLFAAGMGIGGIGLTLWACWTGRIRAMWRIASPGVVPWSMGELWRILFVTLALASLLPFARSILLHIRPSWSLDTHLWMTVSMLCFDIAVTWVILIFAAGKGREVWTALGFSMRKLKQAVRVGFRGYLALFPWIFLLLMGMVELSQSIGFKPPLEPIHELIFEEHRSGVLGLTVLLACLVGPVAEELFFRGIVYAMIRRRTNRFLAMAASGALFSLTHTNWLGFLPIMVFGCLLADLYERTGSLLSPMAVHILHNTFLMSLALVVRQLSVSG